MDDIKQQIDDVLTAAFSREFWLDLHEELSITYAACQAVATGNTLKLGEPELIRTRAQIRHYGLNSALRRAAQRSGYASFDAETNPKGENYVIVSSQGVRASRIGVNHNKLDIKAAKHRSLLAELNQDLEGFTPDMFNLVSQKSPAEERGSLGVLFLNVNPPLNVGQDRMLDLRVVVPFTNLKGSHYNRSIGEILGLYAVEREVVIPDLAIPVLRKRLREQEG
ncbi:hypothetical protein [Enterobacter cloacae]|uniref:hypothetical protein n=1 Tax=Enterobacter cloacae TaxID=550 RepID=UPI0005893911|nr:hypothetical protein [Enterobacter cloacae]KIF96489.1 hypothetical protein SD66_08885 [Enterobacter cloacae]HCT3326160.1 hypothetical protein [Enterobacter cloacae]